MISRLAPCCRESRLIFDVAPNVTSFHNEEAAPYDLYRSFIKIYFCGCFN